MVSPRSRWLAALQAQNIVVPSGTINTEAENIILRVSGAFKSEKDILAINFAVGDRIIRLADIAEVKREDKDPPDPIFRINGKPGLGLSISMRDGGDVLALGEHIHQTMEELKADLPIGIEPVMVANQPDTVSHSINEFMEALWEAIAIVLGVSVVSLGLRAGSVVIVSIPLVLAIVFAAMEGLGIDLQRISLGALIIALGLLVDDAMITIESMVSRLERGDTKEQAAVFAYQSTALPRLTGTLVTIAGFLPVGFARSDAGEYTFSLFAVVALALLASWVVSGMFAPVVGLALLRPPKNPHGETLGAPMRLFRRCLVAAMRARWITIAITVCLFAASLAGTRLVPEQFFPVLRPSRAAGGFEAAGQCLDPGDARRGRGIRQSARRRPGHRAFLHLCRPGRDPLLPAARRRPAERFLRPVGRRDKRAQAARRGARAA